MSQPDLHKLGRVLIALAEAQAEKDAAALAAAGSTPKPTGEEDHDV